MKHVKWILVGLFVQVSTLHALEVSYGDLLKINGIERTAGSIVLPVERKQYYNIRILGKDTYQFVATCQAPCQQIANEVETTVTDVRPAQKDPNLWIAQVAFNQDWQATFLVLWHGDRYRVTAPANLLFLQDSFRRRVEEIIISAIKEKNEM